MDITSFILGISFVIVVALVAGVVIGLVKIRGLIRCQQDLSSIVDTNAQNLYNEFSAMGDKDEQRWKDHYRNLDSRLDKIISRIESLESIEQPSLFTGEIKALNSRLYTLLSRIESLEKQNKQLLND